MAVYLNPTPPSNGVMTQISISFGPLAAPTAPVGNAYDETGRSILIDAAVTLTDQADFKETGGAAGAQAVRFNGTNAVYTRTALGLGGTFSMCCWVKIVVDRDTYSMVLAQGDGGSNYFHLGTGGNGTLYGRDAPSGASANIAGYEFVVGQWTFIGCINDATPTTGVDIMGYKPAGGSWVSLTGAAGVTVTGPSDTNTFYIGSDSYNDWLNGSIGAVKIWTVALTEAELQAEAATPTPVKTSGLWAAYSFLSGPQTNDESGNTRTLTAGGTLVADSSGPPYTSGVPSTGIPISITATIAVTDTPGGAQHYTETGLSIPIVGTTTVVEQADWKSNTALSVPIVAAVATTDQVDYKSNTALSILIDAVVATTEQVDWKSNTALSIPVTVTVATTDQADWKSNTVLSIPITATIGTTDQADFKETGLSVPVVADVTVTDTLHAGSIAYTETGLSIPITAAVAVTTQADFKETGQSVPIVATVTRVDTYTPGASDWQTAIDSGNLTTMQAWYAANTGYLAEGFLESSMWGTASADVSVTSTWLTTNAAAGRVVNDGGGHWTVTGLRCHGLEIRVANITFRHMHLDQAGDLPGWGVTVFDPAVGDIDEVSLTNIRLEYCTIESGGAYFITHKQRTSNVCTLTYTKSSGQTPLLTVGQTVEIRIGDSTFDYNVEATQNPARATITAVTPTTFSYTKAGSNVSLTAVPDGSYATTFTEGDWGDVIYYDPSGTAAVWDGMVFDHCIGKDYVAAFKLNRGTTVNYCWVPSLTFFGLDPHNTSSSIRGKYCKLYRNLFETGTSSAVSCYADTDPYTEFEIHENVMHAPTDYTVNFPMRPGPENEYWNLLYDNTVLGAGHVNGAVLPSAFGYRRELVGNYLQRGVSGYVDDAAYFTKTWNNKLFDGTPLPDLMDEGTLPVAREPVLIKSCWNPYGGGLQEYLDTWSFTPSPNSTLFLIAGVVQGAHTTTQAPVVTVTGQYPQTFTAVTNTPLQNAAGADASHGMRLWLYKAETGGTTSFEYIRFDPYTGTQIAWIAFWVYEVTNVTGMTLAHSSGTMVTSADTITTTALSGGATSGNLMMAFAAASVDAPGTMSEQAGWDRIGADADTVYSDGITAVTGAMYWRKDFTGTTFTISDLGNSVNIAGVLLTEYTLPGAATYSEFNRPITITAAVTATDQADFEDHPLNLPVTATVTLPTQTFTHSGQFIETLLPIPITAAVTTVDQADFEDHPVTVTAVVSVTPTDKQTHKELGLAIPVVGIVTPTDFIHRKELTLAAASATGAVAMTDQADFKEPSTSIPVVVTVTRTDLLKLREPNLAVPATTAVAAVDQADFKESALSLPISVTITRTDLQSSPGHYDETQRSVPIAATITLAVDQADYDLLALPVDIAATVTTTQLAHDRELGLSVTAVVAVTCTDTYGQRANETGRSITAAVTVTSTDREHFRDSTTVGGTSTVTVADRGQFHDAVLLLNVLTTVGCIDSTGGRPEDLIVQANVTVSVTDRVNFRQLALPVPASALLTRIDSRRMVFALNVFALAVITATDFKSRAGITILHDADSLFLGGERVDRVYAGATQAWP